MGRYLKDAHEFTKATGLPFIEWLRNQEPDPGFTVATDAVPGDERYFTCTECERLIFKSRPKKRAKQCGKLCRTHFMRRYWRERKAKV